MAACGGGRSDVVVGEESAIRAGGSDFDVVGGLLVEMPGSSPAVHELAIHDAGMIGGQGGVAEAVPVGKRPGDFVIGSEWRAAGVGKCLEVVGDEVREGIAVFIR